MNRLPVLASVLAASIAVVKYDGNGRPVYGVVDYDRFAARRAR